MSRSSRRIVLAAAALALVAGPALAGVPAEAISGDMSLGDPKARIQVVEYASASCPHCAHFNEAVFPQLKAKYIDTGKVRFTLKEFLTPPAEVAAAGFLIARCGGRAKYFPILDQVFRSQARWPAGDIGRILTEVGVKNGLSEAQVNSCVTDQAALDALNARVRTAAETDKVNSTPTLMVNGKLVAEPTLEALDKAIAEAAAQPVRAAPKKAKRR